MNKIYFAQKFELAPGKFVMKFSCSSLWHVRTELSPWARTNIENDTISSIRERITSSLQKVGFEVQSINFSSMSITAIKK
jgi:exosome complex RNA-binding protein Rrp42 (RNase PH superfamily)